MRLDYIRRSECKAGAKPRYQRKQVPEKNLGKQGKFYLHSHVTFLSSETAYRLPTRLFQVAFSQERQNMIGGKKASGSGTGKQIPISRAVPTGFPTEKGLSYVHSVLAGIEEAPSLSIAT